MAYAFIAGTVDGDAADAVTSDALNTTGATLIVVFKGFSSGAAEPTLTDSAGNTWQALTTSVQASLHGRLHYCENPITSVTHTFTVSGVNAFPCVGVAAFSGGKASSFDQQNGATTTATTSIATGSVTPAENNEVLVYGIVGGIDTAQSVDVGTMIGTLVGAGGAYFSIAMAYQIQTTATARNPVFSWTGNESAAARIATFKSAGSLLRHVMNYEGA